MIENYHNASGEGGCGWILSPSGKQIPTTNEAGQQRCKVDVAVSCSLFLSKKADGRTGWTLKIEEMFFSLGTNTDGREYIDSPKINGQAKDGSNGVSVYGFHDGSFMDGYYNKALDLVRSKGLDINDVLSEEEVAFCLNRGYINKEGEVLNPPEKRNTVRKDLMGKAKRVNPEELKKQLQEVSSLL